MPSVLVRRGLLLAAAALLSMPCLVGQRRWEPSGQLPSWNQAATCYDPVRGELIAFGGAVVGPTNQLYPEAVSDQTWRWNGETWQLVASQHAPPKRYDATMAWDATHHRIVLHGGYDGTNTLDDTWAWDGSDWTRLATGPATRRTGFACDEARGRMILHGLQRLQATEEHWEFDGQTWTRITSGLRPPTYFGSMAFDPIHQAMLLVAGQETWRWDGTSWTPLTQTGWPLPTPGFPVVVRHPTEGVLLFGGVRDAIHRWDGSAFRLWRTTTPRPDVVPRYDSARDEFVGLQELRASLDGFKVETWVLRGAEWRRLQRGLPQPRESGGLAYDRDRRRLVLVGGTSTIPNQEDRDTWESRGGWLAQLDARFPLGRASGAMVYDEARANTVTFGILSGVRDETFTWDGRFWSQTTGGPAGRLFPVVAYDPDRQVTHLFGGRIWTTTNLVNDEHWLWDGTGWTQTTSAVTPPAREDAGLAYDRARQRLVLFGGRDDVGPLGDTWEWDGVTWQDASPTGAPAPEARFGHAMEYHEALGRIVVFGGEGAAGELDDVWEWDGAQWVAQSVVVAPAARLHAATTYDPVRRQIVLFGGRGGGQVRGDLWHYGSDELGGWRSFGSGCATSVGTLTLSPLDAPRLGANVGFELSGLPSSFLQAPLIWVGLSDTTWGGVALPYSLAPQGMPGCSVLASFDEALRTANSGQGTAQAQLDLPANAALLGLEFHAQGLNFDWPSQALTTSNGFTGVIGNP